MTEPATNTASPITIDYISPNKSGKGSALAWVSINIKNAIKISDCRWVASKKEPGKFFLAFPSKINPKDNTKYIPLVSILDKKLEDAINHAVAEAYSKLDKGQGATQSGDSGDFF